MLIVFGIVVETVKQLQKAIGNRLDNHGVIHRFQLIGDISIGLRVLCGERGARCATQLFSPFFAVFPNFCPALD